MFWVTPAFPNHLGPDASWQALAFEYIIEGLLGWKLDANKTEVGHAITLLGMRIQMTSTASEWTVSADKAREWLMDIERFLHNNCLLPSEASKLCGRLQFLNSKIYGRLGRVLLRPLIWRQLQQQGPFIITSRIRSALHWFGKALACQWTRRIPYTQVLPSSQMIIYSDAESEGYIGLVFVKGNRYWYAHGRIPRSIRQTLRRRHRLPT